MQILIVEDDAKVAQAIKEGLESESYSATVARTGEEGFFLVSEQQFDLVVLDRILPGRDGVDVLSNMRKHGIAMPVLILTAKDTVQDRVDGLNSGADDYLVKPFAFSELLARIRVLLRRGRAPQAPQLKLADLEMDLVAHKVSRADQVVHLTVREFDLLEYLLRHQGQVVSREMLATAVWKQPSRATPLDNVIDAYIRRLRQRIDGPFETKLLWTIRGVGFVLQEEQP